MKEYDCRIAIRLPIIERQKAEQLVEDGKFEKISQVIRVALKEFFKRRGVTNG